MGQSSRADSRARLRRKTFPSVLLGEFTNYLLNVFSICPIRSPRKLFSITTVLEMASPRGAPPTPLPADPRGRRSRRRRAVRPPRGRRRIAAVTPATGPAAASYVGATLAPAASSASITSNCRRRPPGSSAGSSEPTRPSLPMRLQQRVCMSARSSPATGDVVPVPFACSSRLPPRALTLLSCPAHASAALVWQAVALSLSLAFGSRDDGSKAAKSKVACSRIFRLRCSPRS